MDNTRRRSLGLFESTPSIYDPRSSVIIGVRLAIMASCWSDSLRRHQAGGSGHHRI